MAVYQENDKSKWTKDGRSWYFRCYYTDIYGVSRQKQSKFYKTKTEAKIAESEFSIKTKSTDEKDYSIKFEFIFN